MRPLCESLRRATASQACLTLPFPARCRPMSMDPATFANSTVNYYAMTYIGAILPPVTRLRAAASVG